MPDSLGHIKSVFTEADANVSVSSQTRKDVLTAHTPEMIAPLKDGKNSPS